MAMGQVQRSLKAEELYREILDLIGESALEQISETTVRGKLDALLALGKIEGRLTAYTDGRLFGGILPDSDRLLVDWQRIVDSATTDASPVVAYTVGSLWLCLACGPDAPTTVPVRRDALLPGETYLCDVCGQRIVHRHEKG